MPIPHEITASEALRFLRDTKDEPEDPAITSARRHLEAQREAAKGERQDER